MPEFDEAYWAMVEEADARADANFEDEQAAWETFKANSLDYAMDLL